MTDTDNIPESPDATGLSDRLHHLADTAAPNVQLTNPADTGGEALATGHRRRPVLAPALALGVVLVLVAAGIAVVSLGGEDGDEPGPDVRAAEGDERNGPQVAVTFGRGGEVSDPIGLSLRFVDGQGNDVAIRHWSEVDEPLPDGPQGMVFAMGGLLQDVPPGDLSLEATLELPDGPVTCTQPFTVADGDRVVLDLQRGPLGTAWDEAEGALPQPDPNVDCARVSPLEDFLGERTTTTGETYLGLTLEQAERKAADEGLTVRLVGENGMGNAITDDLQPDRLDVWVWDDEVVAAELPCEALDYDCGS